MVIFIYDESQVILVLLVDSRKNVHMNIGFINSNYVWLAPKTTKKKKKKNIFKDSFMTFEQISKNIQYALQGRSFCNAPDNSNYLTTVCYVILVSWYPVFSLKTSWKGLFLGVREGEGRLKAQSLLFD